MVTFLRSPAQLVPIPRTEERESLTGRSFPSIVVFIVPRDQLVLVAVMVVEEESFVESFVTHSLFPSQDTVGETAAILLEVHLVRGRPGPGLVQVKLQHQERHGHFRFVVTSGSAFWSILSSFAECSELSNHIFISDANHFTLQPVNCMVQNRSQCNRINVFIQHIQSNSRKW